MAVFIVVALLLLLSQLPALMAKRVMDKHNKNLSYLPGTGEELFRHLKNKFKLKNLKLEETSSADNFDPLANTVNLTKRNLEGRSLTAVAVVTHEFSHALQFSQGSKMLMTRTSLAQVAFVLSKITSFLVIAGLGLSFISPKVLYIVGFIWLASFIFSVLIHVITLPVELDASYKRALPILEEGKYLKEDDLAKVRTILTACAYTYVAQALSSVILVAFMILRRGRPI